MIFSHTHHHDAHSEKVTEPLCPEAAAGFVFKILIDVN